MSLISSFNPSGAVQGGVAGGQAGGLYGAIAGGVLGGFLGGSSSTGYKGPAKGSGYGLQAAGYSYQTAQLIKKQIKAGQISPIGIPKAGTPSIGTIPQQQQLLPMPRSVVSSPALAASGLGGALSLVGANSLTSTQDLGTIGSIFAGLSGAANSYLKALPGDTTSMGGAGAGAYYAAGSTKAIVAAGGSRVNQGGYVIVYNADGSVAKIYKRRRMNPMNARAARRAIRRIKGARKLLQRIERSLPKARTHHHSSRRR